MERQPSLFGTPNIYGGVESKPVPMAANADPETSHEAARNVVASGKAQRHREIVWSLVKTTPGSTFQELWANANERERHALGDAVELMRRLNDLHKLGLVRQGEARVCRVRGTKMVVWEPTKA